MLGVIMKGICFSDLKKVYPPEYSISFMDSLIPMCYPYDSKMKQMDGKEFYRRCLMDDYDDSKVKLFCITLDSYVSDLGLDFFGIFQGSDNKKLSSSQFTKLCNEHNVIVYFFEIQR